jgi:hypothetical protein
LSSSQERWIARRSQAGARDRAVASLGSSSRQMAGMTALANSPPSPLSLDASIALFRLVNCRFAVLQHGLRRGSLSAAAARCGRGYLALVRGFVSERPRLEYAIPVLAIELRSSIRNAAVQIRFGFIKSWA